MRFSGKVALITGAGRNIGAAIARSLGAEGAAVAVVDIDPGSAEETAGQIRADGGNAKAWPLDIGDASAAAKTVDEVHRHFGGIHILVNNAGIVTRTPEANAPVTELTEGVWDQFFRVNIKGAFLMSQAVSRTMIRDRVRGKIINITSTAGESARPNAAAYCCSKAALAMFTRVLALELGPQGITVNSVAPGFIEIPQPGPANPGREAYAGAFRQTVPMNRLGRPEDIARAVLFLAEDGSDYITGENIRVDGGALAGRTNLPKSA